MLEQLLFYLSIFIW